MRIYEVTIKNTGEKGYYSSLKAIYEDFTKQDIGCGVQNLYNARVRETGRFENRRCVITTSEMKGCKQRAAVLDDSVIFNRG